MSERGEAMDFDFADECDQIILGIAKRPYGETLRLIDVLDARSKAANPQESPALSCADLRLDAALETRQSLAECERLYHELMKIGADPSMLLVKACILVVYHPSATRALELLAQAAEHARAVAPPELLARAEQLLANPKA